MSWKVWWELYPDRLKYELKALDAAGIEYSKDEQAYRKGILCLDVRLPVDGQFIKLSVVFPDLYPYFRFEVYAHELDLPHHQNPFGKNLCLIGRSTDLWRTKDTLASFLSERLPQAVMTGTSNDCQEVAELEQHQAEPFSSYYSCCPGSAVIIGGRWTIDSRHTSGSLLIGATSPRSAILRGVLVKVLAEDGTVLAESDQRLQKTFSNDLFSGRWVRLPAAAKIPDPEHLFNYICTLDPYPHKTQNCPVKSGKLQIRAALFPEEINKWRQLDAGWVFACRYKPRKQ